MLNAATSSADTIKGKAKWVTLMGFLLSVSCHDAKHIRNHEKANGQVPVLDQVMTGIGIAITGV
jgi:hypothetical protein